ncbi:DddA-like double-stranded DNA deaminase toxin [Amycolatopsis halotolerans]|uniref:DddA-like double-stranded DNA deaminase toxin n=1 Tax=Amycolatopsis halotolerans TaxID=330083 RepID=A0ABV7QU67_9PSEU
MAGVEEIIKGVKAAAAKIAAGRSRLASARQSTKDAGQTLAQAAQGATAQEVARAAGPFAETMNGIAATEQLLDRASAHLDRYIEDIRGGGEPDEASGSPPRPPSDQKAESKDPVEKARQELPPPVTRGRGVKTHGRLLTEDGGSHAVTSGRDEWTDRVNQVVKEAGCPYTPMTASADVELKVAARMRDTGIRRATVVVNNQPCTGRASCDDLIGVVLPEGSSLTVHGTGGFKKTYKGGKRWE